MTPSAPRRPRLALAAITAATVVGGLGAGGLVAAAGSSGIAPPCVACAGFVTGQLLREPPTLVSAHGHLDVTLTPGTRTVLVAGRGVSSQTYSSRFTAPTLVVRPGDRLNVLLRNRLPVGYLPYGQFPPAYTQPKGGLTNLHVHGLHVSPKAPQDDVFLNIPPGHSYQYRYDLPANHPSGVFWYHPHHHHYVDMQTFGGQSGAIVVRGGLDDLPGIGNLRDRMMVFQGTEVRGHATTSSQYEVPAKRLILINGQLQPRIDIRPGESQRWRIVNATTERFLRMAPVGGEYWILARDGVTLAHPSRTRMLFLAPGQRLEVLVRAQQQPGRFQLIQTYFDQRPTPFGKQPEVQVATVVVAGTPMAPQAVPTELGPVEDLRGADIAARRRVVFSQSPPKFFINGKRFAHDGNVAPMFRPRLNTVEEWDLVNKSPEWHNFHIHINPYQVVAINGKPLRGQPYWADSLAIPPGSRITIRQRFADFTGRFVMHCHVLVHEDLGMMATVEVIP